MSDATRIDYDPKNQGDQLQAHMGLETPGSIGIGTDGNKVAIGQLSNGHNCIVFVSPSMLREVAKTMCEWADKWDAGDGIAKYQRPQTGETNG